MPLPKTIMGRRIGEFPSRDISDFFRAKGPAQTPSAVEAKTQTPSAVGAKTQTPSAVEAEAQTPSTVGAKTQTPSAVEAEAQTPSTVEAKAQTPSAVKAKAPDTLPQSSLAVEVSTSITQFGTPSVPVTQAAASAGSDNAKITDTSIEEKLKDHFNLSVKEIGELITSAGHLRPRFDENRPHDQVVVSFFTKEITAILNSEDDEVANTARAVLSCFPAEHWAMALEEETGDLLKEFLGRDRPPTVEEWKRLGRVSSRRVGTYLKLLVVPKNFKQAGTYAYSGSATGEDGLIGRVNSHKRPIPKNRKNKAPRIDVLREDNPGSTDTWLILLEIEDSDVETDLTKRMCNKMLAMLAEAIYSTLLSTWFNPAEKRAGIWAVDTIYWKGTNFAPPLSQLSVTVASFPKGLAAARKSKKEAEKRAARKAAMTDEEIEAEAVVRRAKYKADKAAWSPEKLAEHRAYNKRKFLERQAKMSPGERREWLAKERERAKKYR
ncbi:uncharacterized protein DNG_02192 [Cephalotrichum gorgonifer]|uniref:Uncharacterized protein n=1 Tax=Cephalotrichum gorgonifer TaxID=2041049 RepID=A0AAE8MS16_9PEZI|nr:uncharacterized protein DNG_02192 [Cephalotrichum gorgonifer]